MATALEEVTRNALQLSSSQRLVLASFLLEMDGVSDDPATDAAWEQEIQARMHAVDAGNVSGVSYQEVMKRAESRLAP